jgi:hypothetical protein
MFKKFILFSILIIGQLLVAGNKPALACDTMSDAYMASDASNPYTDGPYDPCDNWINWSISFHRTDSYGGTATLIDFRLLNSSGGLILRKEFSSDTYAHSTNWNPTGTDFVGPSTSHTLVLRRYSGPTGRFENINLQVNYVAGEAN